MINHERHDLANGNVVWFTTITDGHYLSFHVWMQVGDKWTTVYFGKSKKKATVALNRFVV